jgi:hypothetical protein
MFFWFKSKTIYIDCFTTNRAAYDLYKINHSMIFTPEWWKSMTGKRTKDSGMLTIEMPTIKRCAGLIDQYKKGFILPLWSDLMIKSNEQGYFYQFADFISGAKEHEKEQYSPAFQQYHHIQLRSPWAIKEKSGINFMSLPCVWSWLDFTNYIHGLQGMVNFKYQHGSHANLLIDKGPEQVITIEAGTPILQFIPLSENPIKINYHHLSDQEFLLKFALNNSHPKFSGNYFEKKRILQSIDKT